MLKTQRRWGILAISVAMSLIVLITLSVSKQKSSPYLLFWIYIGYLAFKGDLLNIYKWIKGVAILNALGFIFILFAPESLFDKSMRLGTKWELLVSVGITLLIKLGILFYVHRILNPKLSTENQSHLDFKNKFHLLMAKFKNQNARKTVLIVLIVCAILFGGVSVVQYLNGQPKLVTKFLGINLGDTKDQVIYALGEPDFITDSKDQDKFGGYRLYKKNEFANFPGGVKASNAWQYIIKEDAFVYSYIEFANSTDKVNSIICYVTHEPTEENHRIVALVEACNLNHLKLYDSEDKVLAELGKPEKEEINNGIKVMFYPAFNMEVSLAKRLVVGIRVLSPKTFVFKPLSQ